MFSKPTIALTLLTVCGISTPIHQLSNFHWILSVVFHGCRVNVATRPSLRAGLHSCPAQLTVLPHRSSSLSSVLLRTPVRCCAHSPAVTHLDPFHVSYRRILFSCKEKSRKDKHILLSFFLSYFFPVSSMHIGKEKKIQLKQSSSILDDDLGGLALRNQPLNIL